VRAGRKGGTTAFAFDRTPGEDPHQDVGGIAERDEIEALLSDPDTSEEEARKATVKLDGLSRIADTTLIVLDEASMVDLPSVHALVKRLLPESRLLMIGDEAQLPPIGIGLVFHKLVEDAAVALRLAQVHRQASATGIPAAASAIRSGHVPEFSPFQGPAPGIALVDARPESPGGHTRRRDRSFGRTSRRARGNRNDRRRRRR
jgi:exodeoxyribonuclease V alpha subunit